MWLPTAAWELHASRELVIAGGPLVAIGGGIGGVFGALYPEGKDRGQAAARGFFIGCGVTFVGLLLWLAGNG